MEASQTPPAEEKQGGSEGTIPEGQGGPAEARTIEGDQGASVEQQPSDVGMVSDGEGNTAFRQSAPPASVQSGVPPLPENAEVEANPEVAGPVGPSGQSPEGAAKEQPTE